MNLRLSLIVFAFTLMFSGCNVSVTSFPTAPTPVEQPVENTEIPPTPFPDTPAPPAIAAPLIDSPALIEIHFFNELDGWGWTESFIVRTNDGGITWYNITPPDVEDMGSGVQTFMLDQSHAWVQKPDFNNFPNNGLLYHTADGGLTWAISSTPFSGGDLNFIDASRGWMLADLGAGAGSNAVAVFQTTDAGTTWAQTYTNDPNLPEAGDSLPLGGTKSDLLPRDMQTAWVGGVTYSPGTVYLYRTDDGGNHWSPVTLELPAEAENFELGIDKGQMQFVSAEDGFLVVRMSGDATQTVVYLTNDGGDTWTLTPTLIPGAGESAFISPEEAIIYNGEQFYVTRDAARTWSTVSPDIVFGDAFAGMDFVNLNAGWIISVTDEHRSLYRTDDGGVTWSPVVP
jgi:photosystem II stability/assembly factor-like uncharacterized protein